MSFFALPAGRLPIIASAAAVLPTVSLLLAGVSPDAQAASPKRSSPGARCSVATKSITEASGQVLVYRQRAHGDDRYYACRWGSTKRVRVATIQPTDETSTTVLVAGGYVAVATSTCPKVPDPGCLGYLRVVDAKTRRVRGTWRIPDLAYDVGQVALSRAGAVAWAHTSYPAAPPGSSLTSIYTMSAGGHVTMLDSGSDIDSASLALGTVSAGPASAYRPVAYWFRAGAPRSAPLP